jgi:hypothetical protein
MNVDYLINKDGSDLEIEQLEAMLSEFRIDPLPPSISRIGHQDRQSIFSRFRISFALGLASVCVVLLATGYVVVNISMSRGNLENSTFSSVPAPVLRKNEVTEVPRIGYDPVAEPKPQERRRRHERKLAASRSRLRPVRSETAGNRQKLTAEERYAYQQVKLALFIAGTKIKIVQNTIDGVDEVEIHQPRSNR